MSENLKNLGPWERALRESNYPLLGPESAVLAYCRALDAAGTPPIAFRRRPRSAFGQAMQRQNDALPWWTRAIRRILS